MHLRFYEKQSPEERWSVCGGVGTTREAERTPEPPRVLQMYKPRRQTCRAESQLEARLMDIYEAPLPTEGRESAGVGGEGTKGLIENVTNL